MVAVAIIGVAVAIWLRHAQFEQRARYHRSIVAMIRVIRRDTAWGFDENGLTMEITTAEYSWHVALQKKYERATRFPWLPIASDPPQPK